MLGSWQALPHKYNTILLFGWMKSCSRSTMESLLEKIEKRHIYLKNKLSLYSERLCTVWDCEIDCMTSPCTVWDCEIDCMTSPCTVWDCEIDCMTSPCTVWDCEIDCMTSPCTVWDCEIDCMTSPCAGSWSVICDVRLSISMSQSYTCIPQYTM